MRHAIFIFVLVILVYFLWEVSPKPERKRATAFVKKHGLRIGLLLLCLFIMLATAVQYQSINLF